MTESYVYVTAFVVSGASMTGENVCFWYTTLQDCNESEAYDRGYVAFRAASPEALGVPADLKVTPLNDYVFPVSSIVGGKASS